jgi:ABC-type transport system involved in multi-copper enzyme maturation permease subunit
MKRLMDRVRAAFDDPNPILVKELRGIFRTKLYIRFLYLSTFAISAMVLLIGATVVDGSISPANAGRVIFQVFFSLALGVLSIVGPVYGATTITSEREAATYESLLLTGMDAARIVLGKFAAAYASLALVLIALAPIAGVVFLFGGVSPAYVLVAFGGVLVALLPAVAFGVAVSAHVPTSRLAILVSIATWPVLVFFGSIFFTVFGAEMQHDWELTQVGPFWFAEALVERFTSLDTLFAVGILPLYLIGTTVWFCLAAAIAGVRPAAEDRGTPLKVWALGSVVGPVALTCVATALSNSTAAPEVFAVILGMFFCTLYLYANVFVNEPPLPPRMLREQGGLLRRTVRRVFGPGARPTMRFSVWFMTGFMLLMLAAFAITDTLVHGGSPDEVLGFLLVGLAMLAFGVFLVSLGTLVRIRTRSGVAARAVLFGTVAALVVLPSMTALILDARALDDLDRNLPLVLSLSPIAPFAGVVMVAERHFNDVWMVLPFGVFYSVLSLVLYANASRRIRVIITQVDESRAALLKRVGEAAPAPPPAPAAADPAPATAAPEPVETAEVPAEGDAT